jgi:hypothetical protein
MHDSENEDAPGLEPVDERVREILQQRASDTWLDLRSHSGSLDDACRSAFHIQDEAIGNIWISLEVPRRGLVELDLRIE